MDNKLEVTREILIFAFRYSLNRSSYALAKVIKAIKDNISVIGKYDLELMIREIQEHQNYTSDIDKKIWFSFCEYLKEELER